MVVAVVHSGKESGLARFPAVLATIPAWAGLLARNLSCRRCCYASCRIISTCRGRRLTRAGIYAGTEVELAYVVVAVRNIVNMLRSADDRDQEWGVGV